MGDILDLLYNFINDKPAPDAKHLSRMAISRIEQQRQRIAELEKNLSESDYAYDQSISTLRSERDELAATVERLRELFNNASGDIQRLFELQPQNMEDGSYEVDGQSLTELGIAFKQTPHQNLNAVRREVAMQAVSATAREFSKPNTTATIVEVFANEYANTKYPIGGER